MNTKRVFKSFSPAIIAIVAFTGVATAGEDPKIAAEVIALTKAQWAAEVAGKSVSEQMTLAADDYTEINSDFAVRLDGKALNVRFGEASIKDGGMLLASDMANPKVQVYGDTAILTYNYVGVLQEKDGKTKALSGLSTRVFAKVGSQWKLVHGHFSRLALAKD